MLDWFIRNWWRWVGVVLITTGLWYAYEGLEVDSRHADALDQIDERVQEIDKRLKDVEIELDDAGSQAQMLRVSAKIVKLEREKSQFQHESMVQLVVLYTERRNSYIKSLLFEVTAVLVLTIGQMIQSRWRRWRNRRRILAAEEEAPVDE